MNKDLKNMVSNTMQTEDNKDFVQYNSKEQTTLPKKIKKGKGKSKVVLHVPLSPEERQIRLLKEKEQANTGNLQLTQDQELYIRAALADNKLDSYLDAFRLLVHRINTGRVVNAVCPIKVNMPIDVNQVYTNACAIKLEAKRHEKFTGVSVPFNHNGFRFTAIYFASGSINCVGVGRDKIEGLDKVIQVLKHYAPILLGPQLAAKCEYTARIANRVISLKVPLGIPLDHMHLLSRGVYWRTVKFHGDIFPGIIHSTQGINAKILFFRTGSLIMTGVTSKMIKNRLTKDLIEKFINYLVIRTKYLKEKQ